MSESSQQPTGNSQQGPRLWPAFTLLVVNAVMVAFNFWMNHRLKVASAHLQMLIDQARKMGVL